MIRVSNFGLGETNFVSTVSGASALNFGPDGTLYVVSAPIGSTNHSVFKVDLNTKLATAFATNLGGVSAIEHSEGFSSSQPIINLDPVSQSVVSGTAVSLTFGAVGAAPVSYQWQRNGANLPGANGPTLTFTSIQQSDSGDYAVVLSNSVGVATSAVAVLNVSPGSGAPGSVSPIAHWRFDETPGATTAADSAGTFNGTLSATGASFVSGGRAGNALSVVHCCPTGLVSLE